MYLSQKQKIATPIINAADHLGFLDAYSIINGFYKSQIIILLYHRVGPNKNAWLLPSINVSDFEKQVRFLTKKYKIFPLGKLAEYLQDGKPLPKKVAVITFDDGYKDNYSDVFPILKKYNIPATLFLVTGNIDTSSMFWFDKIRYIICSTKINRIELDGFGDFSLNSMKDRLQSYFTIIEKLKKIPDGKKKNVLEKLVNISNLDIPSDLGLDINLSWDEVKEMSENGVEFGAHTVNHPILTRVSSNQAKFEIEQSKKDIEKRINQSVNTFSYPNGTCDDFNIKIINLVKNSGFICAVTTIPTMHLLKENLYKLGRLPIAWSYESFKFFTSGLYYDAGNILNRFGGKYE